MPEQPEPDVLLLIPEALQFYTKYDEAGRLFRNAGHIERVRTQELISRYIPQVPATVYDIGGGPGVHAFWLAQQGYTVHLLDAMPLHIEQARVAAQNHLDAPLASLRVGDARQLPFADESADFVLLLGPLYHLVALTDRLQALQEARRVLRPGGILCAAAISRFSSLLDNSRRRPEIFNNPAEISLLLTDITGGQHRNPTGETINFTTTYFHHPDELQAEVSAAALQHVATLAIEGPLWLSQGIVERWSEPEYQEQFLLLLRAIEQEPTLIGASSHLMVVARKPEEA